MMCRILVRQRPPIGVPAAFPDVIGPLVDIDQRRELAQVRRARDRLHRDPAQPLDVVALAREVGLTAGRLSWLFQRAYGTTPYDDVVVRRLDRADAPT
jgi:AraC-like DNA-binding protein